jgi:hypothetical protein
MDRRIQDFKTPRKSKNYPKTFARRSLGKTHNIAPMANKYVQEAKDRVKRVLFPEVQLIPKTPLSYFADNRTVFFMGYKYDINKYTCIECVETEDIESIREFYEIPYYEFMKKEKSFETCFKCNKELCIVRPYDSSHLDFA